MLVIILQRSVIQLPASKTQPWKSCDIWSYIYMELPPNGWIESSAAFCSWTPGLSEAPLVEGSHFLFAVPGTLQLSKYLKYNDLAILDMLVLCPEVKSILLPGCSPDDTVQTADLLIGIHRLFFPSQLFSRHIFWSSCSSSILSHCPFHLTTSSILFFCEKRYCYYVIKTLNPYRLP